MDNVPVIVKIKKIIKETPTIKSFIFDWNMDELAIPNPGEFVMVWNFNNEKPMSISYINKDLGEIGITVKNIGEFTSELHDLEVKDKIGIRGPYGNGFNTDFTNKKVLAIGGGVGMAPINAVALDLIEKANDVDIISAAICNDELLFVEAFKNNDGNIFTCTDDGSCGFKGYASDRTISLLEDRSYDIAFVCGPEIMMEGIFNILEDHNIPGQYSMERYMKCALGLCGQCCVDDTGWRICVEGPIFTNKQLKQITEFGKYSKDASGIKKYY